MMETHELVIAIISAICGSMFGASIGVFVMALMVAASRKPIMPEGKGED
jgi:hypothetical protein